MRGSSIRYLIKTGIKNMWSNRVMAFASIGVLTTCLLIVGAAFLVTINGNKVIGYIEDQNEMNVYLVNNADETVKENVGQQIEAIGNIKKKTFVSKEEGLSDFQDSLGKDGYLLESLKDNENNTIPDMYIVEINDISLTKEIQNKISQIEGVESVSAAGDVADGLTYIRRTITVIGLAITLALVVVSLVIISNTIRATIFARRREINIMKFVGATNSFIRIPFLVEGFLLGLISAIIAFCVIWGTYSFMVDSFTTGAVTFVQDALSSIVPFKDIALILGTYFSVSGIVLGMLGSAISIRNHVKV